MNNNEEKSKNKLSKVVGNSKISKLKRDIVPVEIEVIENSSTENDSTGLSEKERNRRYLILAKRVQKLNEKQSKLVDRYYKASRKWMDSSQFLQNFLDDPDEKYEATIEKYDEEIDRIMEEMELYE